MIVAVGVDHAEVARVMRAIDHPKWGERFRQRVFTDVEIAYCAGRRNYAESFAARFAAKEAVMKALGTGMLGISWRDIEVVRVGRKAPFLRVSGRAAERAGELEICRWHLSLTHSEHLSTAFVVAEGAGAGKE